MGVTIGQHDVGRRRLEVLGGQRLELLGDLTGGRHYRAAVVEDRLRPGGAHVVRRHRRVLVDQLEVFGKHAQLVGGQLAQGHHRAGAAFLSTGDDLPRTVAVDLDVRT